MRIGGFNTAERVMIVAEVGNNHEGNFDVALRLVDEAASTGVDAVKFQTFTTERYIAPSQAERFARVKKWEFKPEQFGTLAARARAAGLRFISTPLDVPSVDVLAPIVDALKVASGDNTFYPLLERVGAAGRPVIISTGASDVAQIRLAVESVRVAGAQELMLLHCVSAYPVPPEETNLRAVATLERAFGLPVGYSDHTLGNEACLAAVAVGARLVEKHFTIDKNYSDFRDHKLSADPPEMRELVAGIRRLEAMLGNGVKTIQPSERDIVSVVRRSIAAARDLESGHVVAPDDVVWLRPGGGFPPGREAEVVGHRLLRALRAGEAFTPDVLS